MEKDGMDRVMDVPRACGAQVYRVHRTSTKLGASWSVCGVQQCGSTLEKHNRGAVAVVVMPHVHNAIPVHEAATRIVQARFPMIGALSISFRFAPRLLPAHSLPRVFVLDGP